MKVVLLGTVFAITILLFCCWAINVPGWYRMAQSPGNAEGTVISKHPEDRQKVDYRFQVGSQTYSGRGAVGDDYERLNPGDKVRVVYDPSDPNLSIVLGSPDDIYKQALFMSGVFAVLVAFPAAFLMVKILSLLKGKRRHRIAPLS